MTPRGFSVTDETLQFTMRVKRLIGRPQEALLCAKAKRQLERRSTPRFEKGLNFLICHIDFIDIVVFQQHCTSLEFSIGVLLL